MNKTFSRTQTKANIVGQYKVTSGDKVDVKLNSLTPTYFAAALYIDNASWDGDLGYAHKRCAESWFKVMGSMHSNLLLDCTLIVNGDGYPLVVLSRCV
ncbi:hypothetical protein CUMW_263790 [Citrus unshiu]|uniref:Uncharacterized protein n=1 Tax=Citrus unshiu TaxID=55188 RepID=A0A2H5QUT8_CITUN|nr:hypothetical protein CUMW_263790 [Citrus unshiu]